MKKENYYISHVIVPNSLEKGEIDQLFYYTVKDKTMKDGKFYWGRGSNAFSESHINSLLSKKEIQKLNSKEYPLLIKEDQTLVVDNKGNIYKTSSFLPMIFKKKIDNLEKEVKK